MSTKTDDKPKALTRDQILKADDLTIEPVDVPEWGGTVYVRVLSGEGKDTFELLTTGPDGARDVANFRAKWVAACACDETGAPLFSAEDVAALGRKSGDALDRVFDAGWRLNKMGQGAQEELEKNSVKAPTSGSGSS